MAVKAANSISSVGLGVYEVFRLVGLPIRARLSNR